MVPLFRLVGKPSLSLAYSLAWSRLSPRASSSCVIMPRHSPKRSRQSSTTVGLHEQATAYRKPTTRLPLCALAPVYFLVCSEADMSQKRSERTMQPSNASVIAPFPLVPCTQTYMFTPTERWRTNNRKEGSPGNPPLLGIHLVLFLEPGEPTSLQVLPCDQESREECQGLKEHVQDWTEGTCPVFPSPALPSQARRLPSGCMCRGSDRRLKTRYQDEEQPS